MVPHFVLTVEKLWLLPPSHSEPSVYWLRGLEKLAVTMGGGSESPYIYAEFLALSSVYDQLLGNPNQAKLRVIKETYESTDLIGSLCSKPRLPDCRTTRKVCAGVYLPALAVT